MPHLQTSKWLVGWLVRVLVFKRFSNLRCCLLSTPPQSVCRTVSCNFERTNASVEGDYKNKLANTQRRQSREEGAESLPAVSWVSTSVFTSLRFRLPCTYTNVAKGCFEYLYCIFINVIGYHLDTLRRGYLANIVSPVRLTFPFPQTMGLLIMLPIVFCSHTHVGWMPWPCTS